MPPIKDNRIKRFPRIMKELSLSRYVLMMWSGDDNSYVCDYLIFVLFDWLNHLTPLEAFLSKIVTHVTCSCAFSSIWSRLSVFAICTSPIILLFCPPKFCITFVFHFSWVLQPSQEKLKTMLLQNFGRQTRCILGYVQVANCGQAVVHLIVCAERVWPN